VTEGASNSIFVVRRGVLVTREEGPQILSSITRLLVLDCAARLGIPVYEGPFMVTGLHAADELLLAGTSPGVWGITCLDGAPVGGGRPGPVTRRLAEAYFARVAAGDDRLGHPA
jgi:D-alanine transaminase